MADCVNSLVSTYQKASCSQAGTGERGQQLPLPAPSSWGEGEDDVARAGPKSRFPVCTICAIALRGGHWWLGIGAANQSSTWSLLPLSELRPARPPTNAIPPEPRANSCCWLRN